MSDTVLSIPSDSDFSRVRVLVIGDAGVGKSSFVHKLCHGSVLKDPRCTVGCNIEVMLHRYAPSGNNFFVELCDLGGHPKYKHSRDIFYSQINGIVLCFDMTNQVSYSNLRKWIREVLVVDREKGVEEKYMYSSGNDGPGGYPHHQRHTHSQQSDERGHSGGKSSTIGAMPVLIIGNKADAVQDTRTFDCIKDFGLELAVVSSTDDAPLASNPAISGFLDKVICRRFYRNSASNNSASSTSSFSSYSAAALSSSSLSSSSSSLSGLHKPVSRSHHVSDNPSSEFILSATGSDANLPSSYSSVHRGPSFANPLRPSFSPSSSAHKHPPSDVIDISQLSSLSSLQPASSPRNTTFTHRSTSSTRILSSQQRQGILHAWKNA
jgi:Rab-like protein 3